MTRPQFTLAESVARFETSRSTLLRGIRAGRFPNAHKDPNGTWIIPVDDLLAAHITHRATWSHDQGHDRGQNPLPADTRVVTDSGHPGHDQGHDVTQLQHQLALAEAEITRLTDLRTADRELVTALQTTLRMLEPSPTPPAQAHVPEPAAQPSYTDPMPNWVTPPPASHRRWWQRR